MWGFRRPLELISHFIYKLAHGIQYFSSAFVSMVVMEAILKHRIAQSYQQESSQLLAFIRSKVRRNEDAEDILQDVFYQAMESLNALEPIENLAGWLYAVARNRIIDWYRKKKEPALDPAVENVTLQNLVDENHVRDLDEHTRSLVIDSLWDAIEELPIEQRTVIVLQSIEGIPFREIAAIEDVSINTLLARKRYAIRFLKKRLHEIRDLIHDH